MTTSSQIKANLPPVPKTSSQMPLWLNAVRNIVKDLVIGTVTSGNIISGGLSVLVTSTNTFSTTNVFVILQAKGSVDSNWMVGATFPDGKEQTMRGAEGATATLPGWTTGTTPNQVLIQAYNNSASTQVITIDYVIIGYNI